MPGEATDAEDDTLELTEDMEADDQADPNDEDPDGDAADGGDDPDREGEEETVISFGEEAEPDGDQPNDSTTIRALRKELRETKKRAAELERATVKPKVEIGPKPTLAECNYDEEAYEAAIDAWRAKKDEADEAEAEEAQRQARVAESWQRDLASFEAKKSTLGVPDYQDAQEAVTASLSLPQQAVIVKVAADPAAFIYALGKSEAKLAELAKIDDVIKLAGAVARMEGAIKVVKRRKGPAIDKPASGSGKLPQGGDKAKQLEKLEKDATRTGDRTELIKFKKANGL